MASKPNSGAIFKNDKKTSDQQPNMKGQALIGGIEYWVSAWTNEAQDGSRYQALKFEPKQAQQAPPPTQRTRQSDPPEDDGIPW